MLQNKNSVDFINIDKSVSLGEIESTNKGIITAKFSGICGGSGSAVINSGIFKISIFYILEVLFKI